MYYMVIGVLVVFGVGTLVSFIFGVPKIDDMDAKLFVPPIRDYIEKRQKKRNPLGREKIAMLNNTGSRDKY